MKGLIVLFTSIFILSSCATIYVPPSPISSPVKSGKVAILVKTSPSPTHTHIGTTVFNNFSKQYKYDWNMDKEIYNTLKTEIESRTSLEVITINEVNGFNSTNNIPDMVGVKDKVWALKDNAKIIKDKFLDQNIIAVLQIIEKPSLVALECSNFGCTERYSQGYGIYTRSLFGITRYLAAPSFDISLEMLNPLVDIGQLKQFNKLISTDGININNFNKPKDFKNISKNEFQPVKTTITRKFEVLGGSLSQFFNGKLQ